MNIPIFICRICNTICRICNAVCRICNKICKSMCRICKKKYVKPFAICRTVTSPDFAYLSYVCTPHFADEGGFDVELDSEGDHLALAYVIRYRGLLQVSSDTMIKGHTRAVTLQIRFRRSILNLKVTDIEV